MILQIEKFYNTKVDGRTPRKRKKDLKLKIRQVCLLSYGAIFFLSIFSIESFPVFGKLMLGLFALDFTLAKFWDKGLVRALFLKLEKYEYCLWEKVIHDKKMTYKNRFKYIRKYKQKRMRKFLKKNNAHTDVEYIISRLTQEKSMRLTIATVCISAVFLTISTLFYNLLETVFSFEQTMFLWNEIESSPLYAEYQIFYIFFFALIHLMKLFIIVSPFFFAFLYFKLSTLKSDKLIGLLEEVHLRKK